MDFCKFHDAKNANPAKNAGAILALPTGQGTNPNPDGRNTTRQTEGVIKAQAVTADVTLANIVNCSGNMCQTYRVKWEA